VSKAAEPGLERFGSTPDDTVLFGRLEEQFFLAGDWDSLAQLYRSRLRAQSVQKSPAAMGAAYFRLGQILEERVCDPEAAIESYWNAAQVQPDHAAALRQLRRIHTGREEWSVVRELAELESHTAMAPYQRAACLAEFGETLRVALGEVDAASACFEQALTLDPDQVDAITGLARTRQQQDRLDEAASLWESVVDHQRGPDRAMALISLGALLSGPLDDPDRAAECFRRALTDDPRNVRAVEALISHASQREQWPLLADLHERRFDLAAGARLRSEIALTASRLQLDRLDNPALARLWLDRARELAGDDSTIDAVAADIERRAGNRTGLLEALEGILGREAAPELSHLLEAADLCHQADDDERALEHLRGALLAAPNDDNVVLLLDQCLSRLCRDADRIDVLERRVALSQSDRDRAQLLAEIGQLQEEVLEDPEAACAAWQRSFEHDPQHPAAARELVARLTKAADWECLRNVLERACVAGPEDARADYLCSLGELSLLRFGDPEAAARAFEMALDRNAEAGRALEGLAQIAEGSGDDDAILRAYSREAEVTSDRGRLATLVWELVRIHDSLDDPDAALRWLDRLHEAVPDDRACLDAIVTQHEKRDDLEQVRPWIDALEALESLSTGADAAGVRTRLSTLHRSLGNTEEAIRWAEASLEAAPQQLDTARDLVEFYREERRHEDRVRVQRRLAELLSGEEQQSCLLDLAALVEEQLGDLDGAIVILWRVAGARGSSPDVRLHLMDLLERAGRNEELAQSLLEQRRELEDDSPEARRVDLRRAALLLDPLGQFEPAAELFTRLHEADPDCAETAEGLESALRGGNDTEGLVRFLGQRAERCELPAERHRLDFERAVLMDEGPFELDDVRAAYTALADQDDDASIAAEAGGRLEALLERASDWIELRQRLEVPLERGTSPDPLAQHERLATLCRDRLRDRAGAIEHFEAAGAIAPERPRTWQALALLYDEEDRRNDLRRVIDAELACELEPDRESALRTRAARLWSAEDQTIARAHYERVLELDAGHAEAVEFLVEHYEAAGEQDQLVELLEARLARETSPDSRASSDPEAALAQRTSLRLRIASLHADSLGNLDAAIAVLEPAREENAAAPVVAEPLADLLQRAGRSDALIGLCRAVCDSEVDELERTAWQIRLADTLRSTGRAEEALAAYREIAARSERTPAGCAARAALRALYRELDRPEPLAALLVAQLQLPIDSDEAPEDPTPIHSELAALYAHQLDRPHEALSQLRRVLAIDPSDVAALQQAIEIGETCGALPELDELLSLGLDHAAGAGKRAELLERRGRLRATQPDLQDQAVEDLREALMIDPRRSAGRCVLREIYERSERWQAALDCLFVEAREAEPARRVELLEEGVAMARARLSVDATLPWLERLRAELPDDPHTVARIGEVHRQAGRPEALLRTLDLQTELSGDPQTCAGLHADRARVLERDLASPGRAMTALEAALAADASNAEVLRDLARLRANAGFVRGQVEALEQLIGLVEEGDRAGLREQCAQLCTGELGDHERARRHLEAALEATSESEPSRARLLRMLGDALRADGRISEWARVAETELATYTDERVRAIELRRALAETYTGELAALELSMHHWTELSTWAARACDSVPSGCSQQERDAIDRAVLDGLRKLHSPIELEARLTQWLLRHSDDAAGWIELARLRDEVLHSPASAADAYRGALAADPDSLSALRGLRSISERIGAFDEVASTLARELELRTEAGTRERGVLQRSLAGVAWHRLADTERAERALRGALELDANDLDALRSLQTLSEELGAHDRALELYERECKILGDDAVERRMEACLRAGELARSYTNEPRRALAAYDTAAQLGRLSAASERTWADLLLACGERERHAEVFAAWCDRDDSGACATDHLALADHLTELGDDEAALERTRLATQVDDGCRKAWDALALRHTAAEEPSEAAPALERAAQLSSGRDACSRYVAAALAIEVADRDRAVDWLECACQADPASAEAHAQLALVAWRAERSELAERAAGEALTAATGEDAAAETADYLPPGLRLDTALVGARCARERGGLDAASLFLGDALRTVPDHAEALAAAGEVLYESGDAPAARELLERRLELSEPDPRRATHLAIIAEALELAGRDDRSLQHFELALGEDASSQAAHAGVVRCLERAGRHDEAIAALERWADSATEPSVCADALVQAARLELEAGRATQSEALLQRATNRDSSCTAAWCELAALLAARSADGEALEAAERASGLSDDDTLNARAQQLRAVVLERLERHSEAAEAWGLTVRHDPRDAEAALEQSRLLRTAGDWTAAAESLACFAREHPDPNVLELAAVHEERARLLAGPLEDVAEAVACYERALVLDPGRTRARAKLASLLALVPGRRHDAVVAHGELLRSEPASAASLRAVLRVAEDDGMDSAVETGLTLLRALGAASEAERGRARGDLQVPLARPIRLDDRRFEELRLTVHEVGDAFLVLTREARAPDGSVGGTIAEIQAELAAPGLDALEDSELSAAVYGVAALALDPLSPHAETPTAAALDAAVGRRALRRSRRHLEPQTLEDVCRLDVVAWRDELRALAAAVALDRGACELRPALLALIAHHHTSSDPGDDGDLSSLIAASPSACALLTRLVSRWCERIEQDIRGDR